VDPTGDSHRAISAAGCDVVVAAPDQTPCEIAAAARGADVLLGATFRGGVMDRAFLESIPNLRIVAKYTIGVDDVDVDAATELGILVTHCPTEANWGGVAEGTVAMLLALLKKVRERDRHVKSGGWRSDDLQGIYCGARGDGYPGITVGVVGLGRVGRRVVRLLRPWRMRLLAHDPYVAADVFVRHGVGRVDLPELLRTSDVVTLHCNLTPETRGLIDAARLAVMQKGAVLINTARGAIVDLDALCDALEAGRLGAAALDVLPIEPPPADARVLALGDRVLLFPHMVAANQGGTLGAAIPWATAAALAAVRGEVPDHVYNGEAVPEWRRRFAGRSLL
jgi:D-3-phosphoglycerate dehydrogenase / 2-oxoglutarate reductase